MVLHVDNAVSPCIQTAHFELLADAARFRYFFSSGLADAKDPSQGDVEVGRGG